MDMLSQLEVDMLKRTASSDLYQLFRNFACRSELRQFD